GSEFLARISQLPPATQAELLTFATAGDYTTPTCPSCGTKMVLRTAKKGANAGDEFWGCRNYSRGCRRTFQIKSE
ncbi:MAG: topoisomerase DNA-binding C4 zinc finger domain-containing protein, partial [Opitutaceae bacterium]